MRAAFSRRPAAWLLLSLAGACAGRPHHPTSGRQAIPASVDAASLDDARRILDEHVAGDPSVSALRTQVTRLLAHRALEALHAAETPRALSWLRAALTHYTPAELARGGLPQDLEAPARLLLGIASGRGEEARALTAARILMAVERPPEDAAATWRRITEWGERNRTDFERAWVRDGELAEVLREVASVIPASDVLQAATEHLVARRQASIEARAARSEASRLSYDEVRQMRMGLQISAAELTTLYLRAGLFTEAADRVAALGPPNEGAGLVSAVRAVAAADASADAMHRFAEHFERSDHDALAGVCRVGRARFLSDPRFARCLAVTAHEGDDLGLASAHLEATADLEPQDATVLRAAVVESTAWLAREIGADDPAPGRRAWARARALDARWRERFPTQPQPVPEADLESTAAQLELAAGNVTEAAAHLERASVATPASRDAFYTLAEIAWRRLDATEALRRLDAGLALPLRPAESDSTFRPTFALRRAQVLAVSGRADEARTAFTDALASLDALSHIAQQNELAQVHSFRAVALDALGRDAEVRPALEAALEAAPNSRDTAGRAIALCLSSGRWRDASALYRRSRAQLTLEPAWQVYFGLWGLAAARNGHLAEDAGALASLTAIASTEDAQVAWTTHLARRAVGRIDRAALLAEAHTRGQRAEALFYEALAELAAGDTAAAQRDLRDVVATDTLHYFEYEMAWEFLRRASALAPH